MSFRGRYNEIATKVPVLNKLGRSLLKPIDNAMHKHELEVVRVLRSYVPNSVVDINTKSRLTLQAAGQIFPLLVETVRSAGGMVESAVPIDEFAAARIPDQKAAEKLKLLLDKYGSDKANRHNYHLLYGPILAAAKQDCVTLEIGLGSNNTDVPSNMGRAGRPGASLRAFSEFRSDAEVLGADIDQRILFNEGRIKTYFVDQTEPSSFEDLGRKLNQSFDLVIDDGLHSPNANLATMNFALPRIVPGGWFIVEDIGAQALPIWQIVKSLLPSVYDATIINSRAALMFAVQRAKSN